MEDIDVIQVEETSLSVKFQQHQVHKMEKGGRGTAKAKKLLIKFIQLPITSTKSGLLFVFLANGDLPVLTLKVEGWVPAYPMKGVQEIINVGQRMGVLDSCCIKLVEINTEV